MKLEDREKLKEQDSDALINLLKSSDEDVRIWMIIELGNRKELRAVENLIELLEDNEKYSSPAQYAAWALGEIGDKRAVDPLIAVLDKPFVSGNAIEALVKVKDEKAFISIIRLFEQRNYDSSLATILGNWGDRRALEPLIKAMSQMNSHVRFYAARALGKLGDPLALPILEWARDNDTAPITDTENIRGKSVSYVAAKAIERIKAAGK